MMCICAFIKIIEFIIAIDWSVIKDCVSFLVPIATLVTTFYFARKSYLLEKKNLKLQNFNPEIKIIRNNRLIWIIIINTWLIPWSIEKARFIIWSTYIKWLWEICTLIWRTIPPKENIISQEYSLEYIKKFAEKCRKNDKELISLEIQDSIYNRTIYLFDKKDRPELYE